MVRIKTSFLRFHILDFVRINEGDLSVKLMDLYFVNIFLY